MPRYRTAIIACGTIARVHARAWQGVKDQPVALGALADTHPDARREFGTFFRIPEDKRYADFREMLDAERVARALEAWGYTVHVLTANNAAELSAKRPTLTLPDEDVSHMVVERYFPRAAVRYDTAFLRWDKTRTVKLLEPEPRRTVPETEAYADLANAAEAEAAKSLDWWRQVGAAIAFADGTLTAAHNHHLPHPMAPYEAGDPRSNFFKGVHLEPSTAEHAEARLIARAARAGRATAGATVYVTDFPCPPCAKLLAGAGIQRLIYRTGYAVLDGQPVLEAAGVEIVNLTA